MHHLPDQGLQFLDGEIGDFHLSSLDEPKNLVQYIANAFDRGKPREEGTTRNKIP